MSDVRRHAARAARTATLALYLSGFVAAGAFLVVIRAGRESYPYTDTVRTTVVLTLLVSMLVTLVVAAVVLRWTRRSPGTAPMPVKDVLTVLGGQVFAIAVALGSDLLVTVAVSSAPLLCLYVVQRIRGAVAGRR